MELTETCSIGMHRNWPLSLSGGGALWGRDPVKHAGFIYFALSSTQVEYWRTAILLDFSQFH